VSELYLPVSAFLFTFTTLAMLPRVATAQFWHQSVISNGTIANHYKTVTTIKIATQIMVKLENIKRA
jgi:hypothetical protein